MSVLLLELFLPRPFSFGGCGLLLPMAFLSFALLPCVFGLDGPLS